MELLIGIALIASAILNIILFFKIWKMTNDVKEMKGNVNSILTMQEEQGEERKATNISDTKLFNLVMSDKANADTLLRTILMNEYFAIIEPVKWKILGNSQINSLEPNDYVRQNFAPIIEKYTKFYNAIGMQFPSDIAKLNADDYKNFCK
jgi:hypothetical protein